MIKKNIISFFSYNYFAQKFLDYFFLFTLRKLLIKTINFFLKNYNESYFLKNELTNSSVDKKGWSIIFLTYNVNNNLKPKIKKYKEIFKLKNHEIIILANFNKKNISIKGVRLINLNSKKITLGKKRNLAVKLSNYSNLIMSLDYFVINKFKLKDIEKEILKNDLLIPKIKTLDKKRYLDWVFLDYPRIGKSLCPYNLKDRRYMFFHGSYLILKKKFIKKNLFSNYLDHQQGEDVDWSLKVRKRIKFKLSKNIDITIERFSYESEVLNDKNFLKNSGTLIKNA
tara:strand:- start:178 stop:1026 length:849 start_codon:yes stop_codon:yes gene_type:complete